MRVACAWLICGLCVVANADVGPPAPADARLAVRDQAVVQMGCTIGPWLGGLEVLIPQGARVSADRFRAIGPWPDVATLRIHARRAASSEAMRIVEQFPQIRFLEIRGVAIDAGDLRVLQSLKRLSMLELVQCHLAADALPVIAALDLMWLDLSRNGLTDADVLQLRPLVRLRHLGLNESEVHDAGLLWLRELKSLESLELDETLVAGTLFQGEGFRALQSLSLNRRTPGMPDSSLDELGHLPQLSEVSLRGHDLSLETLRKIAAAPSLVLCDLQDAEEIDGEWSEDSIDDVVRRHPKLTIRWTKSNGGER